MILFYMILYVIFFIIYSIYVLCFCPDCYLFIIYSEYSNISNILFCHSFFSHLYSGSFLSSHLAQNHDKKVNIHYFYWKILIPWLFLIFVCWSMFTSLPKALFFRSGNSFNVLFMSSAVSWYRYFSRLRKQMKPYYTFNMFKVKH